jgi:hypothetical protein
LMGSLLWPRPTCLSPCRALPRVLTESRLAVCRVTCSACVCGAHKSALPGSDAKVDRSGGEMHLCSRSPWITGLADIQASEEEKLAG